MLCFVSFLPTLTTVAWESGILFGALYESVHLRFCSVVHLAGSTLMELLSGRVGFSAFSTPRVAVCQTDSVSVPEGERVCDWAVLSLKLRSK